jgi:hypothetical protein
MHPLALEAAVAAEGAALKGKFWRMHDLIFENQKYLVKSFSQGLRAKLTLAHHRRKTGWDIKSKSPK